MPAGGLEMVDKVLGFYAKGCPAYQTVKDVIEVSWVSELREQAD